MVFFYQILDELRFFTAMCLLQGQIWKLSKSKKQILQNDTLMSLV